jgi:hypothetical protein
MRAGDVHVAGTLCDTLAQFTDIQTTRSQIMKRIKQIVAAALVAAALLGASSQGLMAQQDTVPAIASMCCYRP